ncbi:formate C-acetyltransferase/glycerol dehydratase family glycyl radical enzyme, partial [bacterium]|nr:formate C-acetyltransferase/glycerol dehydratase family glycyl radical enzyme [bacterium]
MITDGAQTVDKTEGRRSMPEGIIPYDKEWPVGESGLNENPSPFARVNRFRTYALDHEFTVDHQRACLLTEAYRMYEHEPQIVKCALALAHVLRNVDISIAPDELIVGEMAAPMKSAAMFPEHSFAWVMDEIRNHPLEKRLHDVYHVDRKTVRKLKGIEDYWKGKTLEDAMLAVMTEEQKKGTHVGRGVYLLNLYMYGGIGHLQANYEKLFDLGFGGLKKQVIGKMEAAAGSKPGSRDFYQAELIVLDAASGYLRRYAALAREMAKEERNILRKK